MSGPDGYICFSAQDFWYHNRAHSDVQLMRRVAAQRPVLFVNSIGMRMPLPGRSTKPLRRIARKLRSVAKLVRRPFPDLPGFRVMTPLVLPLYGSARARALNARLVRLQVTLVARALRIANPVLVVTIPTAWDAVRRMRRHRLVVNRSDEYSAFPEADGELIAGLERELLRHADHVLYVSRALMAKESPLSGDRAHFLDHGVDLEHFQPGTPAQEPGDLAAIPHPRIGFFGGLDDYIIDFGLLGHLARTLPDAHLVLIGDATCSLGDLTTLPNVHWLGFRDYADIPAYGSGFDVALMPWLAGSSWIQASNPIKLKEYLALGLPVVSVDFAEVRHYAEVIAVARDADDFVAQVRAALATGGAAAPQRRAAVAGASWERKAADLIDLAEGA